ncbi:MAG: phage portal protein [Gemmatales bacterium]
MKKSSKSKSTKPKAKPAKATRKREKSIGDGGWISLSGGSPLGTVDSYKTRKEPNKTELALLASEDVARACSKLIAETCSAQPIRLYSNKVEQGQTALSLGQKKLDRLRKNKSARTGAGLTEIVDHDLIDLLQNPNPWMSWNDLMECVSYYLDANGEAFIQLVQNQLGGIQELWILPSQYVNVTIAADGLTPQKIEWVGGAGRQRPLDLENIVHFTLKNLFWPYARGWSPIRSVYQKLLLAESQLSYQRITLDNQAVPSFFMAPEEPLGQHEANRLAKSFQQSFKQSGAGGVCVLTEKMQITPAGYSPKDALSIDYLRFVRNEIASGLGVPLALVDSESTGGDAVIVAAHRLFIQNTIKPRLRMIEEKLNKVLMSRFGDESLFLCFDDPATKDDQLDIAKQQTAISQVQAQILTVNEYRRDFLDLPPVAWGDKPVAPDLGTASVATHQLSLKKSISPKDLPRHDPKELEEVLSEFFRDMGADVVPHSKSLNLESYKGEAFLEEGEHVKERWQWKSKTMPAPTFDLREWSEVLWGRIKPVVQLWGEKSSDAMLSHVGVTGSIFPVVNERVADVVEDLGIELCKETLQTTALQIEDAIERLKSEIMSGVFQGDTSRELTKRVQEVFDQASNERAWRIATTEESRIRHTAEIESAKASGVNLGKKFLLDKINACPLCVSIKKKYPGVVPLETAWTDNPYTQESYGLPVHPHCMCSQSYEIL